MKILYAIQGTGNGHIARATEMVPELEKYADVDVLLSGQHNELKLPLEVKYKLQGFGFFFGKSGGIDFFNSWWKNSIVRFVKEVVQLPLDQYDFVISDFEPISAWACHLKGITCVAMSHQVAVAEIQNPRFSFNNWLGKKILNYYAPANIKIGFHFRQMDDHIFTPIIRKKVRKVSPQDKGYYTVYLPSYSDVQIISVLAEIKDVKWNVFSKNASVPYSFNNISVHPVDADHFVDSIANCAGVLCNAGFETPAEALFLGKKLCVIPMKQQYEQACNAEMLKSMGVTVLSKLSSSGIASLRNWLNSDFKVTVNYPDNVSDVVEELLVRLESAKQFPYTTETSRLAATKSFII